MRLVKWCFRLALMGLTLVALTAWYLYGLMTTPMKLENSAKFEVSSGDTFYSLGQALHAKGYIQYPFLTRFAAKLNPQLSPKVGEYALEPDMTLLGVMALFDSGKTISYSVTLLEGKTTQEFLQAMAARGNIEMTLLGLSNEEIATRLNLSVPHAEGRFFANTYRYRDGDTDVSILKHANTLLISTLEDLWQSKAKDLPYKSSYEALIMASIIEKETGAAAERPLISRVFISRLEKRMRLQTDPTVIYGLGDSYNGNITRKHLKDYTPYNTYQISGLPPTPIANVGKEAIFAALNPGKTKALYFVAKGDGTHAFSNTLKAHNVAVKKYQFKRRADYRSTLEVTN